MILAWFGVAAGVAMLYFGAEWLVRGGAGLARRAGLSPLAVGLTVVSLATSAPELGVSLQAALDDKDAVAVGNVLGSNVANIGLILGLAALMKPIAVATRVVKIDLPLLVLVSGWLTWVLWNGVVTRLEGALLVAGLVAYVTTTIVLARRESAKANAEADAELPPPAGSAWIEAGLMVAGLALLAVGSWALVEGAVIIARAAGLSDAVIGLTVVAFGTSLPELAATAVAAAHGEGDMAVGNVVGSNMFNALGIIGTTACVAPLSVPGDGPEGEGLHADLLVMLAAAIVLLPLLRTGYRVNRWEGLLLIAAYGGYVSWLFVR
ncbi:calcium/sodium antiporter [Alienimonas californiensis]|uniref:Inner membrane protein YrbG n=1 Tax=Alienimonas californiensis TaxID=2527989 RepID=A0A517P8D0_9PLAN|nr:calcium/sodium antiporter [Alienimonas californiensis]QDT15605.1 Inner membrane protein YrbG [Alienimonas californiensis]